MTASPISSGSALGFLSRKNGLPSTGTRSMRAG
jgi:hypothetical protein